MHIREDLVDQERFYIDQLGLDAIGRMGGHGYSTTRNQFDLPIMSHEQWLALEKAREEKADNFAVDRLSKAAADPSALKGWLDAQSILLDLGNISWNIQAIRLLGNFGTSVLCSRAMFQDAGYSHPNFELRMLHINDRLTNSQVSHDLVASFETCRTRP
ncbi:MAG: hypothetical protein E5W70_09250 [Mesorhizobium sp.]|uniref:hypothetical protein n=1 Tax=Mesorhizobium sp. TaxID=1871066 RepID=UPI0011F5D05D|nr:hypothetical protein [Mesorhizobium sp.]TIT23220.1 MAG: hypothetical protein E5W70_09250 [Mesorhizobium sp.]TKB31691.1 MAG: hypothetical protein E5W69_01335 [Mesorhizobium sp.]